jgi:prepilin-type N-terminal cleavage/methylation domain-containing protein
VSQKDRGFSLLELLIVIVILAIVAAFAIPSALNSLRAYKLHSDAAALAAQMNVARFRATSQFTPYRLSISTANGTYTVERLSTSYGSPVAELGPVNIYSGNAFVTANPGGSTYPGTITGGTAVTNFYFNTRGMPVDNTGNPIANGGAVIYLTNNAGLTDAVAATLGGRIGVYNWDGSAWKAR